MNLPALNIGELKSKYPIIQGGMGIGISLANLSGHVAKFGGIGIISTAQIGCHLDSFEKNPLKANLKAIPLELEKARKIAQKGTNGLLGFNVMASTYQYGKYIEACVKAKADVIISGGGLPTELPGLVKDSLTKIAPIVSSSKGCNILLKYWDKHFGKTADFLVVEGPKAGGHLGFKLTQLETNMDEEVKKIISVVQTFSEKYQKEIPVIFAGGVFDKKDIEHYLFLGCSGVQMATSFVTTEECDAPKKFKDAYLNATKDDLVIIKSPVGMPARAIKNSFTKKISEASIPIEKCRNCLAFKHCDRKNIPYCISEHLLKSAHETPEEGLVFAGENVWRLNKMTTVQDLMEELTGEKF